MSKVTPVLLEARGLDVRIGGKEVVSGLDLRVPAGDSIGILGPNGVGKTTLLMTMAGIRQPASGEVRLHGRPLGRQSRREVARTLGMLTQNTRFAFEASCLDIALSGRHPHLGALSNESPADYAIAHQALVTAGLTDKAQRSCLQLSGGEQRRLALARVLAQQPDVLLADEPTNHLDPAHQVAVLDALWQRLHEQPRAQLLALHDINLATCYCTEVLMLFGEGRFELGPTAEMLTEDRLSRLFDCTIRRINDDQQTVFAVAGRTTAVCAAASPTLKNDQGMHR